MTEVQNGITIRQTGGNIGAEISGVDLADDLSVEVAGVLWDALLRHKVIFFRRQFGLNDSNYNARLGWISAAKRPTNLAGVTYKARISTLDYSEDPEAVLPHTNHWHTDTTFTERPPYGILLRPVVLPPYGGDTLWCNTAAGYQAMPEHLRSFVDRLRGLHSNKGNYSDLNCDDDGKPTLAMASKYHDLGPTFETIHPLVCIHPRSGERVIMAGTNMRHILGLTAFGSAAVNRMVQEYVHAPDNQVRWRWELGDVAVWDNLATQHHAVRDYQDRRVMQRVALQADMSLAGVDGAPSEVVAGDLSQIPESGRIRTSQIKKVAVGA